LGGTNVGFAAGNSSLSKGETLLDTIQTLAQYGIDAIVMRHSSGGSPDLIAKVTQKTVINAGDGSHEHPSQALVDCFTLAEYWKVPFQGEAPFFGKKVLILGDTLHSRVARSNLHLLVKLGAHVVISGPKTVTIRNLELFPKAEVLNFPDAILPEVDAVIVLRIQTERQSQGLIPSHNEYRHFWGLTCKRVEGLKLGAVVLHPGPMNRGIEIDPEVADSEKSLVLKQVENGVYVRMAILAKLVGEIQS
jgi:aspartate carbamoyltransferase catalytic subunit